MSQEKNLSEAEFAAESVLVPSEEIKGPSVPVRGFDFNGGVDYDALFNSYRTTGFQATAFYQAVQEINRMVITQFTCIILYKSLIFAFADSLET